MVKIKLRLHFVYKLMIVSVCSLGLIMRTYKTTIIKLTMEWMNRPGEFPHWGSRFLLMRDFSLPAEPQGKPKGLFSPV